MIPVSLDISDLSFRYHRGNTVLEGISMSIPPAGRCFIIGPNGGGKSTLLRLMAGLLPRQEGEIRIDGTDISRFTSRELARKLSYLPQFRSPSFPYTVLDTVVMGRAPHLNRFSLPDKSCYERAEASLEQVGVVHLKDRLCTELSGGEWQLVGIARALTQDAGLLLLDEPTVHLDMAYRERVLALLSGPLLKETTLVMVSHFPDIALRIPSRCLLVKKRLVAPFAASRDVLSSENLSRCFGIPIRRLSTVSHPQLEVFLAAETEKEYPDRFGG